MLSTKQIEDLKSKLAGEWTITGKRYGELLAQRGFKILVDSDQIEEAFFNVTDLGATFWHGDFCFTGLFLTAEEALSIKEELAH